MRAGQRERVWDQFERVTEVDDVDGLAGVEHIFERLRFETCGAELPQEALPTVDSAAEEAENAEDEEQSSKTAKPIEHAWIFGDEVAEEAAGEEQRASPDNRAARVEYQEAAKGHSGLARDRRSDDGEAGNELGEEQRISAALAEGIMGAADADGRLQRKFT